MLASNGIFGPLRVKQYRSLWFADTVSNFGSWMHTFAAGWVIANLPSTATEVAAMQAAAMIPAAIILISRIISERPFRITEIPPHLSALSDGGCRMHCAFTGNRNVVGKHAYYLHGPPVVRSWCDHTGLAVCDRRHR